MPLVATGDFTLADVNDGMNGRLTQDSCTIATAADGTGGNYASAVTTMSILLGLTDDSANWTVTASPSVGLTGNLVGKTYSVTALTTDTGYVDLTAARIGFASIVSRFTVTKARQGYAGPALTISADAVGFTFTDDIADPADQLITVQLHRQNAVGQAFFFASNGAPILSDNGMLSGAGGMLGVPLTGVGDTCYVRLSDLGDDAQMYITAVVGELTAVQQIVRLAFTTAEAGATRNLFRGDWQSPLAYSKGDQVVFDGQGWSCLVSHVSSGVNQPPTFPTTANTWWTIATVKGDRGTITTAYAITGSVWSDSEANAAIVAAGGVSPIRGDVVTLYNSSTSYSQTSVRTTGGAWAFLAAFFGGDVLVDGTVSAQQIAANTITANEIEAGTITANEIESGTITANEIAIGTILAANISAGAIGATQIGANVITSTHLSTGELITLTAQIKDAIITNAKITDLSATKITAGTALAGSVTVSGTALSTTTANALDPATVINTAVTQIDPGKILISGGTSLADWRMGGDLTKIDGGNISANTIQANALTIGNRALTVTGVVFEHNSPVANSVAWTSGTVAYIDNAGASTTAAISSGNAAWTTGTLYLYWVQGSTTISTTTTLATAQGSNNVILATYAGGVNLITDYGRTIIDGSTIKTGTLTAGALNASTAYITQTAHIANAVITEAKISGTLSAAIITTGTALAGSVTVSGTALSTTTSNAANPASVINAGVTTINPGNILISGSTLLSDWRMGGDLTKINGGAISANTIAANTVTIGVRGVEAVTVMFDYNSASFGSGTVTADSVSWSTGTITYMDNAGATQTTGAITAGTVAWTTGTLYLYWVMGATTISNTTNLNIAQASGNVILATYKGGTNLNSNYGRTIINGGEIKTNTITAQQIQAQTITGNEIAAGTIVASKMTITDNTNMVPDEQLQDAGSWTNTTNFLQISATSATAAYSIGEIRCTTIDSATKVSASKMFPVKPLTQYYFSYMKARISGTTYRAYAQIQWFDNTGASIGTSPMGANTEDLTNTSPLVRTGSVTSFAEAVSATFRWVVVGPNTDSQVRFWAPTFRLMSDSSLIVPGAIQAGHIATGTITADKMNVTDLSAISANLGTIEVDTLHIKGNAVTLPIRVMTGGDIRLTSFSTWVSVAKLKITRVAGLQTELSLSMGVAAYGSAVLQIGIFRGATLLRTMAHTIGERGRATIVTWETLDTSTGTGSTEYSFRCRNVNSLEYNYDCLIGVRLMKAIQYKR